VLADSGTLLRTTAATLIARFFVFGAPANPALYTSSSGRLTASKGLDDMNTVSPAPECSAYNVPQAMARIGVGRDKFYSLIREGKLPARKIGRRTLILATDLEKFLAALPRMGASAAS